jgi:hypothetical protein
VTKPELQNEVRVGPGLRTPRRPSPGTAAPDTLGRKKSNWGWRRLSQSGSRRASFDQWSPRMLIRADAARRTPFKSSSYCRGGLRAPVPPWGRAQTDAGGREVGAGRPWP